jgi:hypothetical protein
MSLEFIKDVSIFVGTLLFLAIARILGMRELNKIFSPKNNETT